MTLDEAILAEAKSTRDRLLELQRETEHARIDLHHSVRRLHVAGGSMREIAEELGLSHQRIHQIVDDSAAGPAPRSGRRRGLRSKLGPFERFTRAAKATVVLAQEEARGLGHNYVGTEHLLLGVLRKEDGGGAQALGRLGIELEQVRAAVVEAVGRGEAGAGAAGAVPFTPRAKRVLEGALKEARALGHRHIGTEHLLLALAADARGLAAQILQDLGTDAEAVRKALEPQL